MFSKISALVFTATLLSSTAFAASHSHHHGHGAKSESAVDTTSMPVAQGVSADACWVRLLPLPAPSAGYFVLKNMTGSDVVLVSAVAPKDYEMLMLHQTRHENGMSRMAMTEEVTVAAQGQLEFKPGGYHIMLEQPKRDVAVGDLLNVDLVLKSGEKVVAQCEVKPAGTLPGTTHKGH